MRLVSCFAAAASALFLSACTENSASGGSPNTIPGRVIEGEASSGPGQPQPASVQLASVPVVQLDAFARSYLNTAQALSFRDGIEYCGFFFLDNAGRIQSTEPRRGEPGSCVIGTPPQGLLAGWHTHSSYNPDVIGEVPSPRDLLITFEVGLDGYVATPGGRLWRMNAQARNTVQVCGTGCLLSDPNYRSDPRLQILDVYTLPGLLQSLGVSAISSGRVIIDG